MDSKLSNSDRLFEAMAAVLEGQLNDDVIPILITASARALVTGAGGEPSELSKLLLKFCFLVQGEAVEMLRRDSLN